MKQSSLFVAAFLTIGIPSVRRDNDDEYLQNTLNDLIANCRVADHQNIVIVVFLADDSPDYNRIVQGKLATKYERFMRSGFLQIIQALPEYYPKLNGLEDRNFNDSFERTRWRSKQVADYALMFAYAQNISQYYLQLEDDVVSAPKYFESIQRWIGMRRNVTWAVLDFSSIGFIGRLVRSEDLRKLSMFMLNFYDEMPVDWLMGVFMNAMAQKNRLAMKPSLFQHVGKISSLKGKIQPIQDKSFRLASGKCRSISGNPLARQIYSNMRPYKKFTVKNFYECGSKFWATDPGPNRIVEVIFDTQQFVDRIEVNTGDSQHPQDRLQHGYLVVGTDVGHASCANKTRVGEFVDGKLSVDLTDKLGGQPVFCFVIVIAEEQNNWIVFNDVTVITTHRTRAYNNH